ncbi:DUF1449 family protein [Actinorugispora endophytica]|uniref:DUF1449 family protein n=1 Tax=Actinorugispora endophytica TaxID=1605990 RepID=A0A4R6UZP5_9ACTN|nr:DUF1449 family protein [Actinorugispora endophytica]TDQ53086.1 hypothetical protein EV190_105208 [Actinorugispora endophytica]
MSEFLSAALGFPTALFSFALIVVIGYWVMVVLGALGLDLLDADVDEGAEAGGFAGFMSGIGLGGIPVTVSLSLVIAVSWFTSLTGAALLDGADLSSPMVVALGVVVLAIALVCAWAATSLLAVLWRRFAPDGREPSQRDFVGRVCVIRTGRVDKDFGQAEVSSADGSTALVQVRQNGDDPLTSGSTALIFEYDDAGAFFWVTAYDAELDPDRPVS